MARPAGFPGPVERDFGWVQDSGDDVFVAVTGPADGRARGLVVFWGPLGTEAEFSHRSTVRLAVELASRGVATVRVDPPGVGDSSGRSIESAHDWPALAVRVARRLAGEDLPVVYAGLRTGAVVAAEAAAADADARGVLAWDPVSDVRRYFRARSSLLAVSTGLVSDPDRVAIPGAVLSRTATRELAALSVEACRVDGSTAPTLALVREDRAPGELADLVARADRVLTLGHAETTCDPVSFLSLIPGAALAEAAVWVDHLLPEQTIDLAPRIAEQVRPERTEPDRYREQVVRVGPAELLAVETRPAGPAAAQTPWVVFHHAVGYPHHGPGRAWVTSARELARDGVSSVRWDRSGVGDSGLPCDDEITPVYARSRYTEAEDVLDRVDAPDERVTLVGLCSGGLAAAVTGLAHPRMRVVYVAPQAWNPEMKPVDRADLERAGWDLERATPPRRPQTGLLRRAFDLLRRHNVYVLWRVLSWKGITQIPGDLLRPLAAAGVRTTLVFPRLDWALFVADHGPRGLRSARRTGWDAEIVHLDGEVDDHNLWSPVYLDAVVDVIREVALRPWAPVAGGPRPAELGAPYPGGAEPRRRPSSS